MYKNNENKHKNDLNKNHVSRVGDHEKVLKQEHQHPTYNTLHFHNPTSLGALSHTDALSVAQMNVKACM